MSLVVIIRTASTTDRVVSPVAKDQGIFNRELAAVVNELVQYGSGLSVGMFATCDRLSVPDGWLICDGAAVPRAAYPELFRQIGTAYGAGDGSTTFNLPDKAQYMAALNDTAPPASPPDPPSDPGGRPPDPPSRPPDVPPGSVFPPVMP